MGAIYGSAWASQYGATPSDGASGAIWQDGLSDLSDSQIRIGLHAMKLAGPEFVPSLPKFRAACLNVPSLAAIKSQVYGRVAGHLSPFLRGVYGNLDLYRFRHVSSDIADRMLLDAYAATREHVLRGGSLPEEPAGALEPPKITPHVRADDASVQRHLDSLGAFLNASKMDDVLRGREPGEPA